MDELIAFLSARLDEDEAAASEIHRPRGCGSVDRDGDFSPDPIWCSCDYPARVRREVGVLRAILDGCKEAAQRPYDLPPGVHDGRDDWERSRDEAVLEAMEAVAGALAVIWEGHPDCRQEWKP